MNKADGRQKERKGWEEIEIDIDIEIVRASG